MLCKYFHDETFGSALLTATATCRLFMRWSGTASQNIAGPVRVTQMQRAAVPHSIVRRK